MRERLVGTCVGRLLLEVSRWKSLREVPPGNPEKACAVANGIISDRLIASLCRPGGTFIDIGAHIGSVFSAVHHHDPSIEIIAFEAEPEKASALRRRFPKVRLFGVAVGESEGTAEFFVNSQSSGYSSLVAHEAGAMRKITVRLASLDDLLGEAKPDLIKIDIEGAELGALRGGERLIERGRPTIMFESVGTEKNALDYSPAQLWEWFQSHQYDVLTPDRLAHDSPALTCDAFLDAHEYPFRTHNYYSVARERRIEIRERARVILGIVRGEDEPKGAH